jgi:hypothetical protein
MTVMLGLTGRWTEKIIFVVGGERENKMKDLVR